MRHFKSLNITIDPNGSIVVASGHVVVFSAIADKMTIETWANNIIEEPAPTPTNKESWVIGSLFSFQLDKGPLGIFVCTEYDIGKGFAMRGLSVFCRDEIYHTNELGICRQWQPAYDDGDQWLTKSYAKSAATDPYVIIPKDQ